MNIIVKKHECLSIQTNKCESQMKSQPNKERKPLFQREKKCTSSPLPSYIFDCQKCIFAHNQFIYLFIFDFRNAKFLQFGERIKLIRTHFFLHDTNTATLEYLSHAFICVCALHFSLITIWMMCKKNCNRNMEWKMKSEQEREREIVKKNEVYLKS